MIIAITGATGFLGPHLIARLQREGHQIRTLGRRPTGIPNTGHFAWDALAGPLDPRALEGVEAVFSLAGEPIAQRWNADVKRRIRDSRVLGTRNLVDGIRRAQTSPVLISSSAIGYYGDRGDNVLTESSRPGKDFLAGVCIEWEHEAERAFEIGCRVATVRTGIVLGKGGGALKQMATPFRAGVGGPVGSGRQWVSWIHIDDITNLCVFVLQNSTIGGAVNGTSPGPLRNADFAHALGRTLGKPAVVPVPTFGLKLLYGEAASALVASQRVIPETASQAGFRFRYTDCESALAEIFRH